MKKILLLLISFVSINAFATCDYVVVNSNSATWEANTRSEQLSGIAMAPLCDDLPDDLKDGPYAKYCNNSQYNQYKTIYGAFNTQSCKNLLNTMWSIQLNGEILGTHVINEVDLIDDQTIILSYPSQFYSDVAIDSYVKPSTKE